MCLVSTHTSTHTHTVIYTHICISMYMCIYIYDFICIHIQNSVAECQNVGGIQAGMTEALKTTSAHATYANMLQLPKGLFDPRFGEGPRDASNDVLAWPCFEFLGRLPAGIRMRLRELDARLKKPKAQDVGQLWGKSCHNLHHFGAGFLHTTTSLRYVFSSLASTDQIPQKTWHA